MKIDETRIKKFAGSALLLTALTLGGSVAINEYTVNHNDKICLLNVPMNYVVRAALDILGAEKYNGNNACIMNMINEWK